MKILRYLLSLSAVLSPLSVVADLSVDFQAEFPNLEFTKAPIVSGEKLILIAKRWIHPSANYTTSDGIALALDRFSGKTLWTYVTEFPLNSGPQVADGKFVFGSNDGYLYALDAERGTLIWKVRANDLENRLGQTASAPLNSPITISDGVVYSNSGDGQLAAFSLMDGTLLWRTAENLWDGPIPPIEPHVTDDLVLVGGKAFDRRTGSNLWRYHGSGSNIDSAMAEYGGLAFGVWSYFHLAAMDLSNGKIAWQFSRPYSENVFLDSASMPTIVNSDVVVGTRSNLILAIDAKTGLEHWHTDVAGWSDRKMLYQGDVLYASVSDPGDFGSTALNPAFLYALSPSDGKVLQRVSLPTTMGVTSPVAGPGGWFYLLTREGNVVGLMDR